MATNYDNYNPEIYYGDDPEESSFQGDSKVSVTESEKNNNSKSNTTHKQDKKTKERSQKATKKRTAVSFVEKVETVATSLNVRLVVGIFLGLFGVYLSISFISYFNHCIQDMASIESAEIGTAKGIVNAGGEGGARIADFLINRSFGLGSLVIIFWLFAMTLKLLIGNMKFKSVDFTIKCIVALLIISMIIGLATIASDSAINWGGYDGRYANEFIISFVGWSGAVMVCLILITLFVAICLRDVIKWIMKLKRRRDARNAKLHEAKEAERRRLAVIEEMALQERIDAANAGEHKSDDNEVQIEDSHVSFTGEDECHDNADTDLEYSLEDETESLGEHLASNESDDPEEDSNPHDEPNNDKMIVNVNRIAETENKSFKERRSYGYTFPPTDILRSVESRVSVDREEQDENQQRIRKTLLDFGIPITQITATVGPTVTLYEIVPDKGVKIARIRNLVDDIALSLAAKGVRIIAPIPGKGTVGIEVANKDPQVVSMRTILQSRKYAECRYKLPIALGSTISNEVYIADLAKMPHLLVAGATGQGKSVGLNAIIASLLYRKRPDELKFVMVDPKMVEFSLYAAIEQHYLAKLPGEEDAIITDMKKAAETLLSLCVEMDARYQLLKGNSRNVEEYNEKVVTGKLNSLDGHRYLPYIVVIVDEFADLLMTVGKEVEKPIARLAQKARAVGIHVIIATQRPSTDVITGVIKANFPARIAFKVSSGVDSKTILDTTGAQQLIGLGDMLASNNSEITRVQCAFIDTPEVEEICEYIASQPHAPGPYILPEPEAAPTDEEAMFGPADDIDPLFKEVALNVVKGNNASTSSIQRIYRIGYNRAGRIMDQLERVGIVGPATGGKVRSVLVDTVSLESILKEMGLF